MIDPIDYRSADLAALAPDERLLWTGADQPKRSGGASALKRLVACAGAFALVATLAVLLLDGPAAAITVAVALSIAIAVLLLGARDHLGFGHRDRTVRVTDRRLVSRGGETQVHQLAHEEISELRFTLKRGTSHGEVHAGRAVSEDGELEDAAAQRIVLPTRSLAEADGLLAMIASKACAARAAKRQWHRAWRPVKVAEVARMAFIPVSFADPILIEGESILWRGRPSLDWRRDLRARCVGILRASPWMLGTVAAVALPIFHPNWRDRAFIIFAIIAGLILLAQLMAQFWNPYERVRRLRRTDYVLTTHRLVFRVTQRSSTQLVSNFFDADVRVSLDLLNDDRGTITLGYGSSLELVPAAADVHALVLRAVAGFRRDLPEPPLAQAVSTPID